MWHVAAAHGQVAVLELLCELVLEHKVCGWGILHAAIDILRQTAEGARGNAPAEGSTEMGAQLHGLFPRAAARASGLPPRDPIPR